MTEVLLPQVCFHGLQLPRTHLVAQEPITLLPALRNPTMTQPPFYASPIRATACCLILFSENLDSEQYYKKKRFLLFIEHQTPLKGLLPTNNYYNYLTADPG